MVQDVDFAVKSGQVDIGGMALLGNDPATIAQLRSVWSPTPRHDFDVFVRHVGKLQTVVPAYTAVDMRFAWRPVPAVELSLALRNAFDDEHIEWAEPRAASRRALASQASPGGRDRGDASRHVAAAPRGPGAGPARRACVARRSPPSRRSRPRSSTSSRATSSGRESAFAARRAPFVIGVAGPKRSPASWSSCCRGRAIDGRKGDGAALKEGDSLQGVHIVFIGRREARREALLRAAQQAGALAVTEDGASTAAA